MGELTRSLQQLVIAPATVSWLEATVTESDKTETGAREQALRQLMTQHQRLQMGIETMYADRLDGRISPEFFDAKSNGWREQQKLIDARLAQLATTGLRSATEALQIMKSVSGACGTFDEAEPQQKRAIAAALLKNAAWKAGKFESSWKSPFDVLALSNSASQTKEREKSGPGQDFEIWLPGMDSNHD